MVDMTSQSAPSSIPLGARVVLMRHGETEVGTHRETHGPDRGSADSARRDAGNRDRKSLANPSTSGTP